MIAKGQTFQGIPVVLDGSTFIDCHFDHCEMLLAGVLDPHMSNCQFTNCRWGFTGNLFTAITVMKKLHEEGGAEVVEAMISAIRSTATGGRKPN